MEIKAGQILRIGDRRHTVFRVELLFDSQFLHRIRIHFIHIIDSRPVVCRVIADAEVFSVLGIALSRSPGNFHFIYCNFLVHFCVDTALHDPVFRHLLREGDLRLFAWFEEENMLVGHAVDHKGRFVFHRIDGILVDHIILIRG